jgi:hypothetical protein
LRLILFLRLSLVLHRILPSLEICHHTAGPRRLPPRGRHRLYNPRVHSEPCQIEWVTAPDLTESIDVAPDRDVESWRLSVPAKGACYVLEDAAGLPVLLATCADLRHALVRRLGPQEACDGPSKRVDYRNVVRRVRWRPVFSRFEANWTYLENARRLLPRTYRRLVKHWRVYWVSVDLSATHPRFIASDRPAGPPDTCFGPLPDNRAARRLIEMLEDVFDLCRYHHILVQAPHGQACAYKQMGRCPAPCDGTVSMDSYREQVRSAATFLTGPREPWVERLTVAMKQAAAEQRFEEAQRLKRQIERIGAADMRDSLATLADLRWLILQRGQRKGSVRALAAVGDTISYVCEINRGQGDALIPPLADRAAAMLGQKMRLPSDAAAEERIGLIGWHLLGADRDPGIYLHLRDASTQRIREAVDQIGTRPPFRSDQRHGVHIDGGMSVGDEQPGLADGRQ